MKKDTIFRCIEERTEKGEILLLTTEIAASKGLIKDGLKRKLFTENDCEFIEVIQEGKPKIIARNDKLIFAEPFFPKERLLVLGGGHIAVPLVKICSMIGLSVTVVDDRLSFVNRERFPDADRIVCEDFNRFLEDTIITGNEYIVIITRGHRHDMDCLRKILAQKESIYVGMIGSRRRVTALLELLKKEGADSERLARVCTPIGIPIGAVTPEEISISITAEIIKRKRKDTLSGFYINKSDLDRRVLTALSRDDQEPRAIVTIIDTKGSVPRREGAKLLVYRTGRIEGSIGGGCSEGAIIRDALQIIGTGSYEVRTIDMTGEVAESDGMVCGGIMEVLIEDDSSSCDYN